MTRSALLMAVSLLAGCGASLHVSKGDETDARKSFSEALNRNDGEAALAAVEHGHLDRIVARQEVIARMTKCVQETDVADALKLASGFGIDQKDQARFGRTLFYELIQDRLCKRAVEVANTFELGVQFGEEAVQCVRKSSVIEAGELVCDADVSDSYRKGLLKEAWDALEALPTEKRFPMLDTLVESNCPLPKARAAAWFPRTLTAAAGLRLGRMILNKARVRHWDWDFHAMFRQLLAAAIGLNAENQASEIVDDDAFKLEDADVDSYQTYLIANLRCEEAVKLVIKRKLAFSRAEAIFTESKCAGTSFDGLAWHIKEDVTAWFDLAMTHQKHRLARRLIDKLMASKGAIGIVESAALDAGDFDAVMDFPVHDGETIDQQQDRVFQAALDRNEEWFVVRWIVHAYAKHAVTEVRHNGWIERAYLHAFFRKDWRMAAECIAKLTVPATALEGQRLVFEEALRSEDADAAIDLARSYKLGDDCSKRAALLKSRQTQEAERAKAKAKAAKEKSLRKRSGDWYPSP